MAGEIASLSERRWPLSPLVEVQLHADRIPSRSPRHPAAAAASPPDHSIRGMYRFVSRYYPDIITQPLPWVG